MYKLFVYGSLRSAFKSHAYEYISRFFSFDGIGKVNGKLFDMGTYPAAVPAADTFIVGELYTIRNEEEFSWAIGQLDDYEGVSFEPDEIQLFKRELVDVFTEDAKTMAWIFWYTGSVEGKPPIESGDLIQYLQQKK
ncbi:MAG TPA: gamma-glutamylcyclotransferase family protein [Chitinophagaceae bacterium]|nr:gamma-glutamylcyclotransferase family protein [Chitinophagaceae bacterium]